MFLGGRSCVAALLDVGGVRRDQERDMSHVLGFLGGTAFILGWAALGNVPQILMFWWFRKTHPRHVRPMPAAGCRHRLVTRQRDQARDATHYHVRPTRRRRSVAATASPPPSLAPPPSPQPASPPPASRLRTGRPSLRPRQQGDVAAEARRHRLHPASGSTRPRRWRRGPGAAEATSDLLPQGIRRGRSYRRPVTTA